MQFGAGGKGMYASDFPFQSGSSRVLGETEDKKVRIGAKNMEANLRLWGGGFADDGNVLGL